MFLRRKISRNAQVIVVLPLPLQGAAKRILGMLILFSVTAFSLPHIAHKSWSHLALVSFSVPAGFAGLTAVVLAAAGFIVTGFIVIT